MRGPDGFIAHVLQAFQSGVSGTNLHAQGTALPVSHGGSGKPIAAAGKIPKS